MFQRAQGKLTHIYGKCPQSWLHSYAGMWSGNKIQETFFYDIPLYPLTSPC